MSHAFPPSLFFLDLDQFGFVFEVRVYLDVVVPSF